MDSRQLARQFSDVFGAQPEIFAAPGRVNLIGEHTDYNEGFVMPCAIGLYTRVAISARADGKLLLRSQQFPKQFEFGLDNLPSSKVGDWCDYILGIAAALRRAGHRLQGANILVESEVPAGAGLSSSAAIEVAGALALLKVNGIDLALTEIAKLCQRTENNFIGARVGIMDQLVSCHGKSGHALFLDCRSLEFEELSIPDHVRMVICNTMVKHEHASGEYNRRREECEEGVRILSRHFPGIRALRDVSITQLEQHARELPEKVFNRCRHVIEENERVKAAAGSLRAGDLRAFTRLMRESHGSLRDLYEVSCRELDLMVNAAENLTGFYGGRMTGRRIRRLHSQLGGVNPCRGVQRTDFGPLPTSHGDCSRGQNLLCGRWCEGRIAHSRIEEQRLILLPSLDSPVNKVKISRSSQHPPAPGRCELAGSMVERAVDSAPEGST